MFDKMLGRSFDQVCKLIDRVEKGQSDDAPIELPGTFRHRDTHGKEHIVVTQVEQVTVVTKETDAAPKPLT
jgi:hypothetical protein